MPTFHDPTSDASEASEALQGLAHATRTLDDPADTYAVIGNLLSGTRSLRQVLDQLGAAHLAHRARAHDDDGNHQAGAAEALAAADELHQAGTLLDAVVSRLDAASQHSGRIAWHPATPATPATPASPAEVAAARARLASRLDSFGDPFARNAPRPDPSSRGLSL